MISNTKGLIFQYLKRVGSADLNEISEKLSLNPDIVLNTLETEIKSGFLIRGNDCKYKFKIRLDSPVPSDILKRDHHHYDWEEIQKRKSKIQLAPSNPSQPTSDSPDYTDSPFLKFMPWFNQDERGTCVGHATALLMQANYYAVENDFPTESEMKESQRDVLLSIWNGLCSIRYDKWYRTVFSPQWAYYISRIVGNVTAPAGSFCDAAIKSMVKYGCCLWNECLTDKGARCTPQLYSEKTQVSDTDWAKWQPQFEPLAIKHKLDGFATIRTFDGLMQAIEQSKGRGVIMPINLEMDYMDCEEGGTWKVHPGADKAGSHALWWCGVDRINRKIKCLNTWGNVFVKYTWIDEPYYEENGGAAFAAIDSEEVKIGENLYCKTNIKSNVPCSYTINGEKQVGDPISIALEYLLKYTIVATPLDPTLVNEPFITKDVTLTSEESVVDFQFTPIKKQPTIMELIQIILQKILSFFKK